MHGLVTIDTVIYCLSVLRFFFNWCVVTELERWCSECQVLFTSPEFLDRHKGRCGQNVRGKGKKRPRDDSDLLPPKHLKSEQKPQRDKENTSVRNSKGGGRDAVSQTKDLTDISITVVDCLNSSSQFIAPDFISKQSFQNKTARISEKDVSQRLCHKPEWSKCGSSSKAFPPGKRHSCVKWQDKPHNGSNVSKSPLKTVTFDSHKSSVDSVSPDEALLPDVGSAMHFTHESKVHCQNAQDSQEISNITSNSNQVNLTPVLSQDAQGPVNQSSELDFAETTSNTFLDSDSAVLDSFLSHGEPFLDSLNLEEHIASQEKSTTDSCSQPKHCDNMYSNILNSSVSTTGLRYSHKSEHRPRVPCTENAHIDMLCDGEDEGENSPIFSHVSDNKIHCCTQRKCCSVQPHERRNCSCCDGMSMINRQHMRKIHQQVLNDSENCNCSCAHKSDKLQKKSKIKCLQWQKRHDIECKWKMSSQSTIEHLQIYVRKKYMHSKHVINRTEASVHPQEAVAAHAEACSQGEANKSVDLKKGERISFSCDTFFSKMSNHEINHQNVAKEDGNHSRPVRPCSTSDCGGEASLASLHQYDRRHHGGRCGINVANHSLINGSKQVIRHQNENYSARTQPIQSLIKKREHSCMKSGSATLFECDRCKKKFAVKYNLHEHYLSCL